MEEGRIRQTDTYPVSKPTGSPEEHRRPMHDGAACIARDGDGRYVAFEAGPVLLQRVGPEQEPLEPLHMQESSYSAIFSTVRVSYPSFERGKSSGGTGAAGRSAVGPRVLVESYGVALGADSWKLHSVRELA